jgi:hypothetical protein
MPNHKPTSGGHTGTDRSKGAPSWRTVTMAYLGLTLVGAPMLAYVWETLNRVLSGDFEPVRFAVTIVMGLLLWLFLKRAMRQVERLHDGHDTKGAEA